MPPYWSAGGDGKNTRAMDVSGMFGRRTVARTRILESLPAPPSPGLRAEGTYARPANGTRAQKAIIHPLSPRTDTPSETGIYDLR